MSEVDEHFAKIDASEEANYQKWLKGMTDRELSEEIYDKLDDSEKHLRFIALFLKVVMWINIVGFGLWALYYILTQMGK